MICDDDSDPAGCIFRMGLLIADVSEAEIAAHLAGKAVDIAAVVQATARDDAEAATLQTLSDTANKTRESVDIQGEANAKGSIFAIAAQIAAAHPNAVDAKRASAAALGATGAAVLDQTGDEATTTRCGVAVRQGQQISNNSGNTAVLDEAEGTVACVAAQGKVAAPAVSADIKVARKRLVVASKTL